MHYAEGAPGAEAGAGPKRESASTAPDALVPKAGCSRCRSSTKRPVFCACTGNSQTAPANIKSCTTKAVWITSAGQTYPCRDFEMPGTRRRGTEWIEISLNHFLKKSYLSNSEPFSSQKQATSESLPSATATPLILGAPPSLNFDHQISSIQSLQSDAPFFRVHPLPRRLA